MRLTIFSRLMIGYFAIFFLVIIVSVYAILRLHQLNMGTRHILNIDNRILDYEEKLADSTLSQLRYEKKYVLTKDILLYEQFLSAKGDFAKFLSELLLIVDTPEKKDSLSKIRAHYQRFQSLIDKEIEYVRGNHSYSKRWYEQEMEKASDGILEELKKLETYSRHDIQQRMKMLGESSASARKLVITMSAIAIVLIIVTSFLNTRSITKPLTILMEKTKEISKGVFDDNLNIASPPEISELTGAFNSMCGRLKRVDKMKSDFFSSMSHELRTPLTSIKEGINLLRDGVGGVVPEKQKRLLAILSEETKRLIDLVNSLLDLSKMEAGMMTYTFESGSLAPLIQKAATEMIPLIEAKKITLKTAIDEKLPVVKIDREKILQVLRNLIGNAVKFTPEGGHVRVAARLINRRVEVSVSDTGPGITPENLTAIFEKFHQAHLKNSNYMKGTGLGLAIVKHVIIAHGGKVWAESEPGHGSSFIFVLSV
ncbi:MAG TPA: ATP-binding protein [Thermodesulfobacteriota bacterium]|nr:ATP-binding protein [Thermodesulfobacteriota bacterium]